LAGPKPRRSLLFASFRFGSVQFAPFQFISLPFSWRAGARRSKPFDTRHSAAFRIVSVLLAGPKPRRSHHFPPLRFCSKPCFSFGGPEPAVLVWSNHSSALQIVSVPFPSLLSCSLLISSMLLAGRSPPFTSILSIAQHSLPILNASVRFSSVRFAWRGRSPAVHFSTMLFKALQVRAVLSSSLLSYWQPEGCRSDLFKAILDRAIRNPSFRIYSFLLAGRSPPFKARQHPSLLNRSVHFCSLALTRQCYAISVLSLAVRQFKTPPFSFLLTCFINSLKNST